jgi:hypothetical protein
MKLLRQLARSIREIFFVTVEAFADWYMCADIADGCD